MRNLFIVSLILCLIANSKAQTFYDFDELNAIPILDDTSFKKIAYSVIESRLIVYLLKQTGPANVFMSSYSFSTKSIHQLHNLIEKQNILSFKVLLDNRVRSISPKPFQLISTMFNYRCTSVHAKTALIYNDNFQISIVTSQNATDNPKMERGIIFTDPLVFQFDLKNLNDAFLRGTT